MKKRKEIINNLKKEVMVSHCSIQSSLSLTGEDEEVEPWGQETRFGSNEIEAKQELTLTLLFTAGDSAWQVNIRIPPSRLENDRGHG